MPRTHGQAPLTCRVSNERCQLCHAVPALPHDESYYVNNFKFNPCYGQRLDIASKRLLLAYLTNGGVVGAAASLGPPPRYDTLLTIWWALFEGIDPFNKVNCMDGNAGGHFSATSDCKYPVCTSKYKLWQVGYGEIVCDQVGSDMVWKWQAIRGLFPGETPRSVGQRVLASTAGAASLSFPDVSWDVLISWIGSTRRYAGTTVLGDTLSGRTKLFWVATLVRHPKISAYLRGLASFPCWRPEGSSISWCQVSFYVNGKPRGTDLMCGVVDAWRNLASCGGEAACINAYVSK